MKIFFISIVFLLFPCIIQAQPSLKGLDWSPVTTGTVGKLLTLEAVSGTKRKDVVSYIKVRGPCKFRSGNAKARRTLSFSKTGTCLVRATVKRKGYATWNSGNKKITVTAVLSMTGISWNPATKGTVGTELILDPVAGTRNGDRVTYIKVSGKCSFGSGSEVAGRTLSFAEAGTCVVKATVERNNHSTWTSSPKSITATAPPRLTGVGWSPATTGTVGSNLILNAVSGTKRTDDVSYTKVRGPCKFRGGNAKARRTLVFSDAGICVVRATVKRKGHATWNSGNKRITVTAAINWSPADRGTIGTYLSLDAVSGTRNGDTVAYTRISGQCNFVGGNPLADRTLAFTGTADCVVKATVERGGRNVWDSGNHTITVIKGTITGVDWNPATTGVVGVSLVLDPVGNTHNNDVVTYTRIRGDCRFGSGGDITERTLTFTRSETCVVEATVERPGYNTWNSGPKSISVERGTLSNIRWNPTTSGQVGKPLTLAHVQGGHINDRISYTVISGSCYFGIGTNSARRTLMFPRAETCLVQARLERPGYNTWESRYKSIFVTAGTIEGVEWAPADMGRVGVPLILDAVTGARSGDTVTYVQLSGNCSFGSGDDTARRTLTFTGSGSCVVRARVERPHYNAWSSGAKTITVKPRKLTGIVWNPSTQGSVGTPLVLAPPHRNPIRRHHRLFRHLWKLSAWQWQRNRQAHLDFFIQRLLHGSSHHRKDRLRDLEFQSLDTSFVGKPERACMESIHQRHRGNPVDSRSCHRNPTRRYCHLRQGQWWLRFWQWKRNRPTNPHLHLDGNLCGSCLGRKNRVYFLGFQTQIHHRKRYRFGPKWSAKNIRHQRRLCRPQGRRLRGHVGGLRIW